MVETGLSRSAVTGSLGEFKAANLGLSCFKLPDNGGVINQRGPRLPFFVPVVFIRSYVFQYS